ncbi:MAG: SNF2-related protein, partial [Betaproteobacteria bacterium]
MPPAKPSTPLTHVRVTRALRAIFSETSLARGTTIQWGGKAISDFSARQVEADTYIVCGAVQGTAPEPYETRIDVFADLAQGDFEVIDTECSCPVAVDCKHACALLLHWISLWPEAEDQSLPGSREPARFTGIAEVAPPSAKAKSSGSTKVGTARAAPTAPAAPVVRVLPVRGQLHEWLNRSIAADQKGNTAGGAGGRAKKSTPSQVPCLFYILTDEARLHAVRGRRRRDGSEPELTGDRAKTSWIGYGHERPAYASGDDVAVLTLIESCPGAQSYEPIAELSGVAGRQLLTLAAGTGRLFALTATALDHALGKRADVSLRRLPRPLTFGEARVASLTWREITHATLKNIRTLRLTATIEGKPVELIPTDPPYALDLEANRIAPVSLALSSASLMQLAALPAVPLDDSLAWAYVRDAIDALPDAAAVPPLPIADSGRLLEPKAILEFALVEHTYQHGWGRNAHTEHTTFPGVHLWFDYAGRRVPVSPYGLDAAIEVEQQGRETRTTLARNVRAEKQWVRRLPSHLLRATAVEHTLAQAAYEGKPQVHSLWALAHHDWAHHGAQVFAEAQARGFAIEIDPAFPLMLEDIPEPELELTPTPDRGWFRIALGVTVQDRRVDLAPALAKLIGAQADPEAWLEALPGVPLVLLSIALSDKERDRNRDPGGAKSAVVRLPGVRVHAILAPVFDWFRGGDVAPMSGLQAALNAGLPDAAIRYLGRDDKRWIGLRDAVAEGVALSPVSPHPDFHGTLRPYQLHGLAWLEHLRRLSMAAVLADDMGLGKTVQTLAFLHRRRHADGVARPSLIVAPTSVTVNWLAEATRFAPDLKVLVHRGTARSLDAAALAATDLVVTSYPILQRDAKRFAEIAWDVVVFDEAQMIKNAKAKTYQAAQALNATMRVALTGTPMENHLGELWALFNLLLPGLLGDPDSFNRVFR